MNTLLAAMIIISLGNPLITLSGKFFNGQISKYESLGTEEIPVAITTPKRMWVTITAYSSTPEETDDTPFITAKGSYVRDGIVAANFLDFGTEIRIPELFGEKTFIVEDRMHDRFSDRVDIWFPEKELAKQFGKRHTYIEVVLEPNHQELALK
ncbi:hypothetical protein C4553_03290 [Candidatus Parcubacteria bacterium]|nr:MAG: hypothetical protein C4553_03290 [Candidatus Parcubacteria bacterium]